MLSVLKPCQQNKPHLPPPPSPPVTQQLSRRVCVPTKTPRLKTHASVPACGGPELGLLHPGGGEGSCFTAVGPSPLLCQHHACRVRRIDQGVVVARQSARLNVCNLSADFDHGLAEAERQEKAQGHHTQAERRAALEVLVEGECLEGAEGVRG